MAGITTRQTPPPGPPAQFDPNLRAADKQKNLPRGLTPQGLKGLQTAQQQLEEEHRRLRPSDEARPLPPPPGMTAAQTSSAPMMKAPPSPQAPSGAPAVIHKLSPYPAYRYHPQIAPEGIIVKDPDDEDKRAHPDNGWSPIPPRKQRGASSAEKLELLESLLQSLGDLAEPEEQPLECLDRIIAERNDYALKLAKVKE